VLLAVLARGYSFRVAPGMQTDTMPFPQLKYGLASFTRASST
jgi:hypothetical protein